MLHNAGWGCVVAWERRGNRWYYYTAERAGGRVVKQYHGAGHAARMFAEGDAVLRDLRRLDRAEREELADIDAWLDELDALADLAAAAAMAAAGYHRHRRGEWRKRRARAPKAAEAG